MPTITDVAKRAGVAVGTVSNVINNVGNVTPTTRKKVERAIAELGYVPSASAQSMRSKRTRWLTMVVPTINHPHWHALVRGVEDAAHSHGYAVLLGNTDESLAKQNQYLDVAISQNVAGVIIAPRNPDAQDLDRLRRRNITTVVLNRRIEGWDTDGVYCDNISAARTLVKHLIDLGHKRIAMISDSRRLSTMQERVTGYLAALAEAEIPVESWLIKFQERQATTSEYLTLQLLDEGPERPTAIFAANDVITRGVINTLGQRGLRIPQDMALVCFGDYSAAPFPFLTHILEPGYEMGMNAAQLLFSRIDTEEDMPPRDVMLPSRLIVRYSCGSRLEEEGDSSPSLLIPQDIEAQNIFIKPLSAGERNKLSECTTDIIGPPIRSGGQPANDIKVDVNRFLIALQHQESDRLPNLEFRVLSKSIYEYVLGREIIYDPLKIRHLNQPVSPENQIEFARRLGMDAVSYCFSWQPNTVFAQAADGSARYVGGSVKTWADLDHLEPPPSLSDQLSRLERYLRIAQGTGVGIVASFTSFFDSTLLALGMPNALSLFHSDRHLLQTLMDIILERQERVVRTVCDRFSEDLACVLINDNIAHETGLVAPADIFNEILPQRMKRLIAPAKEHYKPVIIHTKGKLDEALPILTNIGFDAVHPVAAQVNDIFALKKQWQNKIAFIGGFPADLLVDGSPDEIDKTVKEYCTKLAPGGGYVFGASAEITGNVPPGNFVAMTKAVHNYGVCFEQS